MDTRHEIKSLKKALRALTFLNRSVDATVTQLAQAIGVPRTTAYRLLETLASEGYVEKQPYSDFYRLTSLVQRLSAGFQDEDLLVEVAKPLITAAGHELGWPLTLSAPRASDMVVRITTDHSTALALERYLVGSSVPLLNATTGYCYLAHCSESEREAIVDLALSAGQGLLVDADRETIVQRIAQTREQGYCNIEFAQFREGNLGVPLLLAGKPVGGVVMRYIKSALKNTPQRLPSEYVPRLQKLAQDISAEYAARGTAAGLSAA